MQNEGNIRLDVRTLCPVTLHRRVLVWFPAPPPLPSVSLCALVLESPWLFTWIRFDTLVHCSPEQNKRRPTSPLQPQEVTCVATMSEQVETRRKRREQPETTPGWACQNWIFNNENNEKESTEDEVVHMNPCSAATTQLNQNNSAIGHQQMMKIWSKSLKFKSSNLQKWVKPSDGDVYMSLWGQNTA